MEKYKVPESFIEFEESILNTVRQCNEIKYKARKTLPWESKIGGCPYIEDIEEYPIDNFGRPYVFLAQINFEEIYPIELFPTKGLLQFYVKGNETNGLGEEDGFVIKYIEKFNKDSNKVFNENPYRFKEAEGVKEDDIEIFYVPYCNEGKMKFKYNEMPVSISDNSFEKLFKDIELNDEQLETQYECFSAEGSRIGGYPTFNEKDPRNGMYEVLLLQLDIEDECGIMFGDAGTANFFISKEDLLNKDFSKVYYTWDC